MKYIPNIPMPSIKASSYSADIADNFSRDEESKAQRAEILERQKKNTFFYTIRETLKSIAGPLTGAGLGLFVAGMIDGGSGAGDEVLEEISDTLKDIRDGQGAGVDAAAQANPDVAAQAEGAVETAGEAAEVTKEAGPQSYKTTAGLAMLGGAGVATTGALMANATGAKYAHSASFDQLELNAQHTAKYVAQAVKQGVGEAEMEKSPDVVVVNQTDCHHPDHQRADGKSWVQHIAEQQAAAAEQQKQV